MHACESVCVGDANGGDGLDQREGRKGRGVLMWDGNGSNSSFTRQRIVTLELLMRRVEGILG